MVCGNSASIRRCRISWRGRCLDRKRDPVPKCTECGKTVRPDVTLYGEMLPTRAYEASVGLIRIADCFIIGGTSLEVGSAAQLAHMYHGRHLIIINKSKTHMEGKAYQAEGRIHDRRCIGILRQQDSFHGETRGGSRSDSISWFLPLSSWAFQKSWASRLQNSLEVRRL